MRRMFSEKQIENKINELVESKGFAKAPETYKYFYLVDSLEVLDVNDDTLVVASFSFLSKVKITNAEDFNLAIKNGYPLYVVVKDVSDVFYIATLSTREDNLALDNANVSLDMISFSIMDFSSGEITRIEY